MSSKSKAVISWRQRTKLKAVIYLGGKCSRCGYSKCLGSLQFHHKDPRQKDFTISGKSLSWGAIKTELDKCILVCANCHGELHYGNTVVNLLPERVVPICQVCGIELKQLHNKFCQACYKRTTKISWPPDEHLAVMIKEATSMVSLAISLGVSDNAVRHRCRTHNIKIER